MIKRIINLLIFGALSVHFCVPTILFGQDVETLITESYDYNVVQEFITNESVPITSEEFLQLGMYLLAHNKYKEARLNFRHSLNLDSSDKLRKYYFLARSEAGVKNYDQSKIYLEKLLEAGYGEELILRTPELAPQSYRAYRSLMLKYGLKIESWDILIGLISGIGIFLGIFFLLKSQTNRRYSVHIGLFILLFSFNILEYVLYWTRYIIYLPARGFFLISFFLYPPLLYIYLRKKIVEKDTMAQSSWSKNHKHFIFFYVSVIIFSFYWLFPNQHQELLFQAIFEGLSNHWLKVAFACFYLFMIFKIINNKLISSNQHIRTWLKVLFTFYILALVGSFLPWIFSNTIDYTREYAYLVAIFHSIFVFAILILSILQPEIFIGKSISDSFLNSVKYRNSGLTPSMSQELMEKVMHLMIEEKIYLDNDLTLSKLADLAGVDKYCMSQVINEKFGKGFYELINEFRVNEARKKLLNSDKNINDVLYEVGFSNHTSFYRAFKKLTKKTPSEYILEQRNYVS